MNKVISWMKNHTMAATIGLITVMAFVIYWPFISSGVSYLFTNGDGFFHTWPTMVGLSQYMRTEGYPMWNFSLGIGGVLQPNLLASPFYLLPILLGKDTIESAMIFSQIGKIIIAGLFFFLFLKKIKLHPVACAVGSISYAFCGIMITRGSWVNYGVECTLLAMLLYSCERYFQEDKWGLIPLTLGLMFAFLGVYYVYLYGILLIFYAVIRFFICHTDYHWKKFVTYLLRCGGLFFLGILLSALFLLPYGYSMFSSSRFENTTGGISASALILNVFKLHDPLVYLSQFYRFFSSDALGVFDNYAGWNNYLEGPLFYSGLFTLILIPQAIFLCNKREKRFWIVGGIFVSLYLAFPTIQNIMQGFVNTSFKLSSLWICVVMVVMSVFALNRILQYKLFNIKLLLVTVGGLLFLYFGFSVLLPLMKDSTSNAFNVKIAFGVVLFLLLHVCGLFWTNKKGFSTNSLAVIVACVTAESIIFSAITVNGSFVYATEYQQEYSRKLHTGYFDYSNDAIKAIKAQDNGFYRVENEDTSQWLAALFQGYYGSTHYYQMMPTAYTEFLKATDFLPGVDKKIAWYQWFNGLSERPILETLLGFKYYIAENTLESEKTFPFGYIPNTTVGDMKIYKNQYALPLGFTYDSYITRDEFSNLAPMEKDIALLNAMVLDEADNRYKEKYLSFAPKHKELFPAYLDVEGKNVRDIKNELPESLSIYATTDDPGVYIPVSSSPINGKFKMSFEMESYFEGEAQLFWSSNKTDFLENNSVTQKFLKGENALTFVFEAQDMTYLRLDLGKAIGDYHISNVRFWQLDESGMVLPNTMVMEFANLQNIAFMDAEVLHADLPNQLVFEAKSDDPSLQIPVNSFGESVLRYEISFNVEQESSQLEGANSVQLFWKTKDEDYSEKSSKEIPLLEKNTYCNFMLESADIETLRLDVGRIPGKYTISNFKVKVYDYEAIYQKSHAFTNGEPFQLETFSQNNIVGTVNAGGERMLFFSIPYDKGWSAKVDGVPVKVEKVNIGFVGVPLSVGPHKVELQYVTPGLILGLVLSVAGLLIYGALLLFRKKLSIFNLDWKGE